MVGIHFFAVFTITTFKDVSTVEVPAPWTEIKTGKDTLVSLRKDSNWPAVGVDCGFLENSNYV